MAQDLSNTRRLQCHQRMYMGLALSRVQTVSECKQCQSAKNARVRTVSECQQCQSACKQCQSANSVRVQKVSECKQCQSANSVRVQTVAEFPNYALVAV